MPKDPEYHVPPLGKATNQPMIVFRIIVSSAILLMALFMLVTSAIGLLSKYDASRPVSRLLLHDGFVTITVFLAAIPFVILAYRMLYHTLRYRFGRALVIASNAATRSLIKGIIIIPIVAIVTGGVLLLMSFFIYGFPGV